MLLAGGTEGNSDILTEGRKKFYEAPHGKAAGAVSHQQGDLRLLHAEDFGNLGLRLAAALEDGMDLQGELGLEQLLLGIGEAQIGKDVSAARGARLRALLDLDFMLISSLAAVSFGFR